MSQLVVTSSLDDLARVYPWLDEVAAGAVDPRTLGRMHVALEEAVANAAMHGYPPDAHGRIAVRFRLGTDVVELEVEDDGTAFDPTLVPERPRPASLEEAQPGGLGLRLIRRYCSAVSYARADGMNRLRMRFDR